LLFYDAYAIVLPKGTQNKHMTNTLESSEKFTSNNHQIEISKVGEFPVEVQLPVAGDRLVVGATETVDTEKGSSGLEVIPIANLERNEAGETMYNGVVVWFNPDVVAIVVDPLVPPRFHDRQTNETAGFKGLRLDEHVTTDTLKKRFGKDIGFSFALDAKGGLIVENNDPHKPVDILSIKPVDNEKDPAIESARTILDLHESETRSPEAQEELREVVAEAIGEVAIEECVEAPAETVESKNPEVPAEQLDEQDDQKQNENVENLATYERQIRGILEDVSAETGKAVAAASTDLEDARAGMRTGLQRIGDTHDTLMRALSRVEGGDREMLGRTLVDARAELQGSFGRMNLAGEKIGDAKGRAGRMSENFATAINELRVKDAAFGHVLEASLTTEKPQLVGQDHITMLGNSAGSVAEIIGALGQAENESGDYSGRLRVVINMLDNMIETAQRNPIGLEDDLRSLGARLRTFEEARGLDRRMATGLDQLKRIGAITSSLVQG
jgi:hypothetical protein